MEPLFWIALGAGVAATVFLLIVSLGGIRLAAFLLAVLCLANSSEACNRCGLFGNRCRFAAQTYYYQPTHYVQPVTYAQPAQNFIFNNSYPTPLLSQGNSVYGYSLAAQAYTLDPAQVLDRSSRLAELAFTSGQKAIDNFNDAAGNALALSAETSRQQQNTLLALSAIQANSGQPAAAPSLSFRATVRDGRVQLETIEAAPQSQPAKSPAECEDCKPKDDGRLSLTLERNPPITVTSIATGCGRCHDGTGKSDTPKGLVLDGRSPLSEDDYKAAAAAVLAGRMPPKSNVSDETKIATVAELARLRQ